MTLEKLSEKNQLTQEEIGHRLENVSYAVADYFKNSGIDIKYDPNTSTFKNWYGRKFHINYLARLGFTAGSGKLFSNEIKINVLRGTKLIPPRLLNDEEVVKIILHEKIHHDIGIIEFPTSFLGVIAFAETTKSFWGTLGVSSAYFVAREFAVEGIKKIKYGEKMSGGQND